jgi:hypothetical protein
MMLRRRTNDRDFALFNAAEDDSFLLDDDEEVHKADDVVTPDDARQDIFHDQSSGSLSYLNKKIKKKIYKLV